jgi:hypothetical protein
MKTTAFILATSLALSIATAHARLGETEEQSFARYGTPVAPPNRPGPPERSLVEGAKEINYEYEGWKIRAAFVNKITVRIEYRKDGDSINEKQAEAILAAEKGASHWRAVKEEKRDRPGPPGPPNSQREREWVRGDKATAKLQDRDSSIILAIAALNEREKKQGSVVPKF